MKALQEICEHQKVKDVLVIGEPQSSKALLARTARTLTGYGFKYVTYDDDEKLVDIDERVVDAYKLIANDSESRIGWRLLGTCTDSEKKEHRRRAKTLNAILNGKEVADSSKAKLVASLEKGQKPAEEVKKAAVLNEIRRTSRSLSRPLANLEVTVCNTIRSKGLGADIVFVLGFDQGRLPKAATPNSSETYQMLVALTRAKKRIYLVNTVGKDVSWFLGCLPPEDVTIE